MANAWHALGTWAYDISKKSLDQIQLARGTWVSRPILPPFFCGQVSDGYCFPVIVFGAIYRNGNEDGGSICISLQLDLGLYLR